MQNIIIKVPSIHLCGIHIVIIPPRRACASGIKQSALSIIITSKNDKTTSNTLNTYLYCCKSPPRTVNQILHLPSSLRSKNSLHGHRWWGFCIATPLPATQTPPSHITSFTTCTASYSAPRMREAGVEMPRSFLWRFERTCNFKKKKNAKGLYLPLSYYIQGRL